MAATNDVESWMARYDNPMKPVVQRLREIILAADPRIGEGIKWQAPTFMAGGKNLASFFPKSKQHASLMFHEGAKIPGQHQILEGDGATGRVFKAATIEAAERARRPLEAVVRAWLDWSAAPPDPKKTSTTRAPTKTKPKTKANSKVKATATKTTAKSAAPGAKPARSRSRTRGG